MTRREALALAFSPLAVVVARFWGGLKKEEMMIVEYWVELDGRNTGTTRGYVVKRNADPNSLVQLTFERSREIYGPKWTHHAIVLDRDPLLPPRHYINARLVSS